MATTFKLALDAGHGLNTWGRRCLKQYDPQEHREWWLNDRICDYIAEAARQYPGLKILRVDDTIGIEGDEDIALEIRCKSANDWGADLYLSIHHNAGINGGKGGGVTAYSYREGTTGASWRDAFYARIVGATGLVGNRATPKTTADFYVLINTAMPAVLVEHGFMDSPADIPVIISEEFAKAVGYAYVEVIAERAGLEKAATKEPEPTPLPSDGYYRVQVGAYKKRENAEATLAKLKAAGFDDAYIKTT